MTSDVAGQKRKSIGDVPDGVDPVEAIPDSDLEGVPMDSCNVVRGKIHRFIEAGEMKVGEFCDAINVSSNAYYRFMGQNGKDKGSGSDVYPNAWAFFKKRDLAGIKPPKKQKTAAAKDAAGATPAHDMTQILLPGEEEDAVEVYDTCDEIRRKISAHLRKPDKGPKQISTAQFTKFRGYKGPDKGNTSCVFYASYVFFEKLRILEKKPKSAFREEMEKIYAADGGFNTTEIFRGLLMPSDKYLTQDKYGRYGTT